MLMKCSKRRRGRPRLDRQKIDKGTEQLQQKKLRVVEKGQDIRFSESLLGLLYSQEVITRDQYDAGQTLNEIGYRYEPCLGYVLRQHASLLAPKSQGGLSDQQDEKRTKEWRDVLQVLKNSGSKAYTTVLHVVFNDQDIVSHKSLQPIENIQELRHGLNGLHYYFKGESKAEQGKRLYQAPNPVIATTFPQPLIGDQRFDLLSRRGQEDHPQKWGIGEGPSHHIDDVRL